MAYYHSMDREYFPTAATAGGMIDTVPTPSGTLGLSDVRFGISAPPFDNQLQALKARIRQGATHVELGFTGTGKGNMGGRSTTPEMYGKEEREAMRELAKLNEVQLSTHASVGMTGLSGMGEKGFTYERSETVLGELKRAIEFAADTAGGGPIVVHTGEWQRPVSAAAEEYKEYLDKNKKEKPYFIGYPEEEKKGMIFVAREDTGDVQGIPRHLKVYEPEKLIEKDSQGNDVMKGYIRDEKTGQIKLRELTYQEAVDEAKKENPKLADQPGEVLWIKKYFEAQREQYEAETLRFTEHAAQYREKLEAMETRRKFFEKQWNATSDNEERERLTAALAAELGQSPDSFEKFKTPLEFFDKQEETLKREVEWQEKIALSYAKQAKRQEEDQNNLKSIEFVGIQRSAQTLARAALFAYDEERAKKLKKPLFIAPEAWLPEQWGSHPKEIIKLVEAGRDQMEKYLEERGISEKEAEKIAQDHIKATLDIGHMNMWRKFFQPLPGEDMKKTEERFNTWLIDHVKELAEKNIVGHVHITDNFGYHDEHVTPGEGNAPIPKFIEVIQKELKKQGKDVHMIVEPAHQDVEALKGAWRLMGTPVYGLGTWGSIEFSYFGQNQPPYFAIPDLLGVQREWNTSYFGIPFE